MKIVIFRHFARITNILKLLQFYLNAVQVKLIGLTKRVQLQHFNDKNDICSHNKKCEQITVNVAYTNLTCICRHAEFFHQTQGDCQNKFHLVFAEAMSRILY